MSAIPVDIQPRKRIKRGLLPLGVKLKIIKDIEQGVKRTLIQKQYKLASSTLSTILSHREDIKKCVSNSDYCPQRRRVRKSKYFEMEEQLWEWYKKANVESAGKTLTNAVICNKALELAGQMKMSDFKATTGWISRFRQRRGIYRSPAAKLAKVKPPPPANPDLIEHWTSVILPDIVKNYDPNDIFIAHETGLFFRCTPDRMLPYVGERCCGGRLAKERLTVMLVCNMTGTEKLPLVVVDINLQPANQGIIQNLKLNYRRIVLQKYLDRIEQIGPFGKLPISVMDALLWLREAWRAITPVCITEGFKRAGLNLSDETKPDLCMASVQPGMLPDDFYNVFKKLSDATALDPLVTAEGYLTIDSHLVTIGTMSSCEMMVARRAAMQQHEEEDEDDQDEELEAAPSITEARQSLAILLKFFEHVKGEEESFKYISDMEFFIHKLTRNTVKQMTMLDFFTRRANKRSTRVSKQTHTYFFPRS
ncbi:hypothetical protein RRG08_065170 [Elysia crispata]|uniref:HTH CENPB-type domain-containing protein n=1 Tax=Elysia crispata TaxID=231223 RepID=A0AAE0Z037_9GAST|nr:hypothetical protein RRG08_065170 [Elysia crispata]